MLAGAACHCNSVSTLKTKCSAANLALPLCGSTLAPLYCPPLWQYKDYFVEEDIPDFLGGKDKAYSVKLGGTLNHEPGPWHDEQVHGGALNHEPGPWHYMEQEGLGGGLEIGHTMVPWGVQASKFPVQCALCSAFPCAQCAVPCVYPPCASSISTLCIIYWTTAPVTCMMSWVAAP